MNYSFFVFPLKIEKALKDYHDSGILYSAYAVIIFVSERRGSLDTGYSQVAVATDSKE